MTGAYYLLSARIDKYGESMLLYYSRKYSIYNLTFYESVTREGFCFCWGESDGKRGAVEVSTILEKFIQKVDERGDITTLLLYSDSCLGQNKNRIVFAAIHRILNNLCKNIKIIQLNYLLPGHTNIITKLIQCIQSLKEVFVKT